MTTTTCSIEGCDRPKKSRGWCEMHYYRWRRHGDPLVVLKDRHRVMEDLWQFVTIGAEEECWLWHDFVQKTGYAQFMGEPAHRIAWMITNGSIPEGLTIDHLCFVPLCMNPKHLEVVTLEENVRRMNSLNRGRCRKGHVIQGLEDVYVRPNGRSSCRACLAVAQKRFRDKKAGISLA